MAQKFANNFITTLSGNILAADLSLPLTSVVGLPAMVAGDYIYGAIVNASNQVEFFIATAIAGSNLTIPTGGRGIGGSTARDYVSGSTVRVVIIRESFLQLQQEACQAVTLSGTDTYTATYSPVLRGYVPGVTYFVTVPNTNTIVNPTVNFNGIGAKNIVIQNAAALYVGDMPLEAMLRYDGTNMILMNPAKERSFFTTGDEKTTWKAVADTGWILLNDGTIGNGASGATTRANADTAALFALWWNNCADAQCAVSTGRGANAAADFAANKTLATPKTLGRSMAIAGAGSGLTSRALGLAYGVETHPLTAAEGPPHSHGLSGFSGTRFVGDYNGVNADLAGGTGGSFRALPTNSDSSGSGTAHQNMQPSGFRNVMVKL